jgi:Protein of unknown function (DUF1365)
MLFTSHHSIFNDRLGTYTISVRAPFSHSDSDVALRVHLHTPTGALKSSAFLHAKYVPTFRTLTVFAALATHPFILFLTLPRILRQAAVLHYRRHLNVYGALTRQLARLTILQPGTRKRWGNCLATTHDTRARCALFRQRFPSAACGCARGVHQAPAG